MARLTESTLQALLRERRPQVVTTGDGSGLALRITSTAVTWQLRYRHGGKPRWLTLGRHPECSLTEARKRATSERARIQSGVDPVAERRRSKLALKAAKTFRELVADYALRSLGDLKPDTQSKIRLYLNNDILPRLGDFRIDEISGAQIIHMIEQVARRSDSAARRVFQITSTVFAHGIAKQLVTQNPCAHLKLKAILGKRPKVRPGVSLSEAQLRAIMTALPGVGRRNALALKIVLATCVRRNELRLSRKDSLDLDAGTWTIPDSKNGKPILIPLAPVVVGWFRELLDLAGGSPWILPGRNPRVPLGPTTLNRAIERLQVNLQFTLHDLRRTARTHLSRLGVDVITAEKCLNHTLGGLIDVYDRGDYLEERRRALQLLADFLVRCESPVENVVSLKKAS
jgi:integrase